MPAIKAFAQIENSYEWAVLLTAEVKLYAPTIVDANLRAIANTLVLAMERSLEVEYEFDIYAEAVARTIALAVGNAAVVNGLRNSLAGTEFTFREQITQVFMLLGV